MSSVTKYGHFRFGTFCKNTLAEITVIAICNNNAINFYVNMVVEIKHGFHFLVEKLKDPYIHTSK